MEYSRYADGLRITTGPYNPYERSTATYNRALELGLAAAGLTMQDLEKIEVIATPEFNPDEAAPGEEDGKPLMIMAGHTTPSIQSELQTAA